MDNFQWRSKARIVACIDLVFSILGLVGVVLLVVSSTALTAEVAKQSAEGKTSQTDDQRSAISGLLIFLWITTALCTIIICINLWATAMLLQATKPDADPKMALHRAEIWRNVSVAFLVIGGILNILGGHYISLVIGSIIRGVIIYIVCKFIQELKVAAFGSLPDPNTVVINNDK